MDTLAASAVRYSVLRVDKMEVCGVWLLFGHHRATHTHARTRTYTNFENPTFLLLTTKTTYLSHIPFSMHLFLSLSVCCVWLVP